MTIYIRTAAGQQAAYSKSVDLPRKQRALLIAIDGKSPLPVYIRNLAAFGDVTAQLAQLQALGLLTVLPTDAPAYRTRIQEATTQISQLDAPRESQIADRDFVVSADEWHDVSIDEASRGLGRPSQFSDELSRFPPAADASNQDAQDQFHQWKNALVRDVVNLLGKDAHMVVIKINRCTNTDDLFTTFMGVKKIISLYVDQVAADKFATRHLHLA